jgi:hypothetical protein
MCPYVANGELIAAAVHLGKPVKTADGDLNATIGARPVQRCQPV